MSSLKKMVITSLILTMVLGLAQNARAQQPVIFATGVDASGHVTAPERSVDIHYTVRMPGSNTDGPAYIYRRALNDNQTYSPWMKNTSTSAWISAIQPNTIEISGGYFTKADGPVGDYYYTLKFDMTGFDPTTLGITGRWAADNTGEFMYFNGNKIINVTTGNVDYHYPSDEGYTHWTTFWLCPPGFNTCAPPGDVVPGEGTIDPSTVLPGINSLVFQVHNTGGPTGLRVELTATATLLRTGRRPAAPMGLTSTPHK
jgi:hypothetical protein